MALAFWRAGPSHVRGWQRQRMVQRVRDDFSKSQESSVYGVLPPSVGAMQRPPGSIRTTPEVSRPDDAWSHPVFNTRAEEPRNQARPPLVPLLNSAHALRTFVSYFSTDVYSRSAVRLNRCSRECLGQTSAAAAVRPRATFPACSCSGRTTPPFKPLAAPNRRDRPEPSALFLMICCPPGVGLSKKTTPLSPDPAHHTDECTRPRGTQPRGAATTVVLRWRSESVDQVRSG